MTLSVQDRQEIADLVSSYNHAIDHLESEAWAATFTADGALIVGGETRAQGCAALIAYVAERRAAGTPKTRHWTSNILIAGDNATATLRAYVMAFKIDDGLGPPYVLGEYNDDLVKIDGSWKFVRRHMTIVVGATGPRVASSQTGMVSPA
jgi:hypothetical protein